MEFPISDEGIRAALDALLAAADEAGISPTVGRRLAVILDEYSSNLIRHDPTIAADSRFALALEPCEGGPPSIRPTPVRTRHRISGGRVSV